MHKELSVVIHETFITYRGCLITREGLKFVRTSMRGRKEFDSLEAAKQDIDSGLDKLAKSISNA